MSHDVNFVFYEYIIAPEFLMTIIMLSQATTTASDVAFIVLTAH
jgi:hypothetical protein